MLSARIICDSISPAGVRLTTFVCTYPRFLLPELNTHRAFSRSTASSRAIPIEKRIEAVKKDCAMPVEWGKNQRGMQAKELINDEAIFVAIETWLHARNAAVKYAENLLNLGIHKQIVNRILEPFCHVSTVITATDWTNFFALRCHPDTQPEFRVLARKMYEEYQKNTPEQLDWFEWHLPFITKEEKTKEKLEDLIRASAARCARVSYENHEGKEPNIQKDLETAKKLIESQPRHMSPCEHQAFACSMDENHGNFKGWHQFRKTFEDENITQFP